MKRIQINGRVLLLAAALASLPFVGAGCSTQHVHAYERGTLSEYAMRSDRDTLASAMSEHIYFSREASSGGKGVGGSGCGCN